MSVVMSSEQLRQPCDLSNGVVVTLKPMGGDKGHRVMAGSLYTAIAIVYRRTTEKTRDPSLKRIHVTAFEPARGPWPAKIRVSIDD